MLHETRPIAALRSLAICGVIGNKIMIGMLVLGIQMYMQRINATTPTPDTSSPAANEASHISTGAITEDANERTKFAGSCASWINICTRFPVEISFSIAPRA